MIKLRSDEFVAVSKSLKINQKRRRNLNILVRHVAGKEAPPGSVLELTLTIASISGTAAYGRKRTFGPSLKGWL